MNCSAICCITHIWLQIISPFWFCHDLIDNWIIVNLMRAVAVVFMLMEEDSNKMKEITHFVLLSTYKVRGLNTLIQ